MFTTSNKYKKIIKLLKINKPLVFLDIETTGLNISSDRIIELADIKIWPDGRVKKDIFLFNPQIPITQETTAIHGFGNEDVKDKPKFRQKAQEIWDILNDCYYSGYNITNFDLPLLKREFIRIGMDFEYTGKQIIDSRIIFQAMVRRTLSTAYQYYCHKELKNSHNAIADTEASAEILIKQLEKYEEARDFGFLTRIHESFNDDLFLYTSSKFKWKNGEAYFAFSKYNGRPLSEIVKEDPGFLQWMLEADFSDKTKTIIQRALNGEMINKN